MGVHGGDLNSPGIAFSNRYSAAILVARQPPVRYSRRRSASLALSAACAGLGLGSNLQRAGFDLESNFPLSSRGRAF